MRNGFLRVSKKIRFVLAGAVVLLLFAVIYFVVLPDMHDESKQTKAIPQTPVKQAILTGTVIDKDSSARIGGATVTYGTRSIKTDVQGSFKISAKTGDKVSIEIAVPGYMESRSEVLLRSVLIEKTFEIASVYRVENKESKFTPIPPELIHSGNPNRRRVAFTFDDGWNADYRIIDIMKQYGLRGTAFLIGQRGVVTEHPELVTALEQAGFEVATHGYLHYTVTDMNEVQINDEIRRGQDVITKISGKQYPYFRSSGGTYDQRTLDIIGKNGYKLILWSLDSKDGREGSVKEKTDNILANLHNGAIVIFHLGNSETYDMLKILIPEIQNRGYEIGTVSDVLEQ